VRILAFAYACTPDAGSEPGAGWNLARVLGKLGDTVIVTASVNRERIEAALPAIPLNIRPVFVYVDIPQLLGRWTLNGRHHRYNYLLWQIAALKQGRALHRDRDFDLAWHLTIASAWFGSVACLAGPPCIYGPVGGGTRTPLRLLPSLGFRGAIYEIARDIWHLVARRLNPLARLSLQRAELILVQNSETLRRLPSKCRPKSEIFANALLDNRLLPSSPRLTEPPTALYAGELRAFKGVCFAIRALVNCPGWKLVVCGSGPDEGRLRRLARKLQVADRVAFVGWLPRSEVLRRLNDEAHVFIFPSLHEEAGAAVAEAVAHGLAVICIDQGGPPTLAGPAARLISAFEGKHGLVDALAACLYATTNDERTAALQHARGFSLDAKADELAAILARRIKRLVRAADDGDTGHTAASGRPVLPSKKGMP
jgi:glycosyltransferase involved in cell wall biosynthesis